jgi:methyl-CpG-binding domain protein 4
MVEGWEATRQKKRRKKHMEEVEVSASSSQSPRPPATPDSKTESPAPNTAETLTSTAVAAGKGRKRKNQEVAAGKGRKRKKQEVAAASSLVGEAVREEERRKGNRSKPEAAAATPSPSIPAAATAAAQILEVAAEGTAARKEQRRGKLEQWQSGQQPSPVDVHPQGGEAVVDGGVSGSKSAGRSSSGKPRVLTNKEILRERILWLKEHPVPVPTTPNPNSIDAFFDQFRYIPEHQQGHNAPSLPKTPDPPVRPPAPDHMSFLPSQLTANQKAAETKTLSRKRPPSVSASGSQEAVKAQEKKTPDEKMDTMKTEMVNPNSIDQDPKYSSPFGPFVDQLHYIPEHWRRPNAPSLPKTPDPPARPPPRDHLSFQPSHLTANQKAAKTTTLNTKRTPSVSASGSQKAVKVQEKKRPDEKMDTTKRARKKTPVLSAAEKRSDKYRRLPLNQLVPPPCSPYNLLQERYAHDPWKVIVICMLCNATRGNEVSCSIFCYFTLHEYYLTK